MARRNPARFPGEDEFERRREGYDYAGTPLRPGPNVYGGSRYGGGGYGRGYEGPPDPGHRWQPPPPPDRFWHGDFNPYGDEGTGAPGRDPYYGALGYRDQAEGQVSYYHPRMPGRARPRGPKGYQRSDERLQEAICEALMHADYIDSSDVTVLVQDGVAILEGTVPVRSMRYAIEDIADACPGVKDIDNRIRVAPGG